MCKKLSFLIFCVLVLSLASTSYGIVIGNFENNMDGWVVYDDPCSPTDPNVSVSYSDTNGVTLGSHSLKIVADKGRQRALVYNVVNNGKVNAFMSSDHITIDITRLAKEWKVGACSPWSRVYLVILAGSDPCDPNAWVITEQQGQLYQDAGWSPPYSVGDYNSIPGGDVNVPLTRTYNYSHLLPNIHLGNLEYLDIILVTDYDPNYITGGVYYIDNVQMLGTPPTADILLGNFEDQMDSWLAVGDANITRTYSTTGATLGLKSLRIHAFGNHPGTNACTHLTEISGWDNVLEYVIPQSLYDEFLSSNSISIDITRLASEWTGDPNIANFSQFFLCLMSNYGWYTSPSSSGASMWLPAQGDQTKTITFYYPDYLKYITLEGIGWLQIFLCTNYDPNYITGGVYYIDNIRMHFQAVTEAFTPDPCDGTTNVQCDPTLNWKLGKFAKKHDVYFGTDFNDVNQATISEPCGVLIVQDYGPNSIDIADDIYAGLLEFDTTYYWRIDEVNALGPSPYIWPGNVWSFTTGHYLVAENFEEYANTTSMGVVWKAKSSIKASSSISCGQIHSGKQAMVLNYDCSKSPYRSEAYASTTGTNSLEFGTNWRLRDVKALSLWFRGIEDLRGSKSGADPYTLIGDGSGIRSAYDVFYYFYTTKTAAPANGLVAARVDSIENTDPCAMAGVMMRCSTTAPIKDGLEPNAVYAAVVVTPDNRVVYMRRGTVGGGSTVVATVSGITMPHWVRIYRLSTSPFNFVAQHANDVSNKPQLPWKQLDASPLGIAQPIYLGLCVTSDNYGDMCTAHFSYVDVNAPYNTRVGDPNVTKDVGGYVYNAKEPLYVALQDSPAADGNAAVYYENKDANVTQIDDWTEWRIDINDFITKGIDPCNVLKMFIGIGNKDNPTAGGSGAMFFDDIKLYLAEFYEPKCPPLPADLVRDGKVNYDDLKVIADNWLIHDYDVTPVVPPTGPVLWYQLNDNATNSGSLAGHNGTMVGGPTYTTDRKEGSKAIDLDGINDYMQTDANAAVIGIAGNHAKTVTVWVKARAFDKFAGVCEIGGWAAGGQDFSLLTSGDEPNVWLANHEGGTEHWDIEFEYPSLNTWVNIAQTYDGKTVKVYANGYAVAERALDLNTTNTKPFGIGRWSSWDLDVNACFNGIVDDVRVYNYALTPDNAAYVARYPDANAFAQPLSPLLTPPEVDLYNKDSVVSRTDPYINVTATDTNNVSGVTWTADPCAYPIPLGQWYRYPLTGWWNVWLYNAPYDAHRWKEIYIDINVAPIGGSGKARIIVGGSTGAWAATANGHTRPPLPSDVNATTESLYIDRTITPDVLNNTISTTKRIRKVISIEHYNPEWVFIDIRATNVRILNGHITHECRLDIINFRDFAELGKHWGEKQVWPTWDP